MIHDKHVAMQQETASFVPRNDSESDGKEIEKKTT